MDKNNKDNKDLNQNMDMLQKLSIQLEKSKFAAYVDLMQKPARMIVMNFFAGLARGFGFAMGFTILGAIVLYFVQKLVLLNLPVLGGIIAEIVKLVQMKIK